PAIQKVRAAADRMRCESNMRQLVIASHNFHNDYYKLPMGAYQKGPGFGPNPFSFSGYTCFMQLLPYIEEDATYRQIDFDRACLAAANASGGPSSKVITLLICPTDDLQEKTFLCQYLGGPNYGWYAATSYVGNGGTFSYYPGDLTLPPDGVLFLVGPAS